MRIRTILLAAALAAHGFAAQADDTPGVLSRSGWNGLHTPNFYVMGDAGQRELREVARRLEQFRETLGILFPKTAMGGATPTTVLVFKTHRSYEPVKPVYHGKAKDIVGFFQPGSTVNYITMTTEDGFDGLGVTYHEYVHLVVNNTVRNMPLWFNEGLADYYSTFDVSASRDKATLGKVIAPHLLLLRQQWVPLEQLAAVDHSSPLYNESDKMSVFYAESWVFVHYLLLGNDHQLGTKASAFLTALINGTPFADACAQTLGMPVPAIEKELRNYVGHEVFRIQQARFTQQIGGIDDIAITPVPEVEVHATLGDLLLHMQREDAARAEVAAALALDPAYGPAHATLGTMALFKQDYAGARPELEKAAASPSATYLCHYFYALTLANARRDGATLSREEDASIEAELRKSVALNPDFPDTHAQLAWQLAQTPASGPEAVTEMERALDLAPGKDQYALGLASMLTRVQDYSRAKSLLRPLASRASEPVVRQQASELLTSILDYERHRQAASAMGAGAAGPEAGPGADGPGHSPASGAYRLVLRDMGPGETRVTATMTAIQCSAAGIVLVADLTSKTLHLGAKAFNGIDFISYRSDLSGKIECGARHDHVLLTYRGGAPAVPDTDGTVVAVEFVPDDYTP
jgi:Flp pilus assembly protein TadD